MIAFGERNRAVGQLKKNASPFFNCPTALCSELLLKLKKKGF
jgi:hypothetical protein